MKFADVAVKRGIAGLGLFAASPIKKGVQIIEYTGERISEDESNIRGGKYLFTLDNGIVIDGKERKNIARYINHSCRPNSEAVLYDDTQVIIEAIRSIAKGEEITYDYGEEYVAEHIRPYGCRCAHCTTR